MAKPTAKRKTPAKRKAPAKRKTPAKPAKRAAPAKRKTPAKRTRPTPPPAPLGPFEREGQLTWAILAELDAADLERRFVQFGMRRLYVEDLVPPPRPWCVLSGKKGYAALIDTQFGNVSGEARFAERLSKELSSPVYALSFSGYDDPDRGLPYIERYVKGKKATIWMESSHDDEYPVDASTFVAGPKGVPSTDPFAFAKAFGFDLRGYYEH